LNTGNRELSALFITDPKRAIEWIVASIDFCNGNLKDAAARLKVGRTSLYRWMKKYPQIRLSVQRILEEVSGDALD
jgi:transcriptional regulator of acetoin/glycerol metabolism